MKTFKLILSALLLLATPAHAQFGFEGSGLIDVAAAEATYKGGITVLTGDVVVKQGDAIITADKMTIYREETTNGTSSPKLGEITRIVAEGNFTYTAPENTVTGDRGIYKRSLKHIDVFGNVRLKQGDGNFVDSDSLFYDLTTRRARFKNECSGPNCGRINFGLNSNQ